MIFFYSRSIIAEIKLSVSPGEYFRETISEVSEIFYEYKALFQKM